MIDILVGFMVSVGAGVVANLISKWLDRRKEEQPSTKGPLERRNSPMGPPLCVDQVTISRFMTLLYHAPTGSASGNFLPGAQLFSWVRRHAARR